MVQITKSGISATKVDLSGALSMKNLVQFPETPPDAGFGRLFAFKDQYFWMKPDGTIKAASARGSGSTSQTGGISSIASGSSFSLSAFDSDPRFDVLHLYLHLAASGGTTEVIGRFNSDSTAGNYLSGNYLNGASPLRGNNNGAAANWFGPTASHLLVGSNYGVTLNLWIFGYNKTNIMKRYVFSGVQKWTTLRHLHGSGIWKSTDAITSIDMSTTSFSMAGCRYAIWTH